MFLMQKKSMRKIIVPVILLITHTVGAQQYQFSWGEELKLRKGTADLQIISADAGGTYFYEERKAGAAAMTTENAPSVHSLYKLDKNLAPVFDKEYRKELKKMDFEGFRVMGEQLFLFASQYEKKERLFRIYGAEVNKQDGELKSDFLLLGRYELENKKYRYDIQVAPVGDGTRFLLVSNISAGSQSSVGMVVLDPRLKTILHAVIRVPVSPDLYQVQDVVFTKDEKFLLLGKEFTETLAGKRKRTRLVFKQYLLSVYSKDGLKEKDIPLEPDNRYIINGRLIEQAEGNLLLAGFYSLSPAKEELNGFFIQQIDPQRGSLLMSSFKEINASMLGDVSGYTMDDEKEDRKWEEQAGRKEEEEEFPGTYLIRSVDINPVDRSILITGEISRYSLYTYYSQRYHSPTRTYTGTWTYNHRFINQDILVIHADAGGSIRKLYHVPKSQIEEIRVTDNSYTTGFNFFYAEGGYFSPAGGMPFYSSFKPMLHNNRLVLLLNDHVSNNVNPAYGDKVRNLFNFRKKSNVYAVSIDLGTGEMKRRILAANSDETVLMPRHAFVSGNEFIIPSWRQHLVAKTELRFARVSVK